MQYEGKYAEMAEWFRSDDCDEATVGRFVREEMDAIRGRHSVRSFTDEPIPEDVRSDLETEIERCNGEGGLSIALVCDEPEAFDSTLAHYGKFSGVRNYLVLAGPDAPDLEERCGYYGERLVLLAQWLGLNSCRVAQTFKKRHVKKMLHRGDRLIVVVALGYGTTQGSPRKSKDATGVCKAPADADVPDWFVAGVDAALLAPTAMNQQSFEFELTGRSDGEGKPVVALRGKGGAYSKVDLGIVRLHFEIGAASAAGEFSWGDA